MKNAKKNRRIRIRRMGTSGRDRSGEMAEEKVMAVQNGMVTAAMATEKTTAVQNGRGKAGVTEKRRKMQLPTGTGEPVVDSRGWLGKRLGLGRLMCREVAMELAREPVLRVPSDFTKFVG